MTLAPSAAYSRGPNSCPLGKLTRTAKTRLDDATMDRAEQIAHEHGMGLSEWMRDLVMVAAWGEDHLRSVYERRLAAVSRKGPE